MQTYFFKFLPLQEVFCKQKKYVMHTTVHCVDNNLLCTAHFQKHLSKLLVVNDKKVFLFYC